MPELWVLGIYIAVLVAVGVLPLYTFFRGSFHLGRTHKAVVRRLMDEGKTQEAAALLREFTGKSSLNRNSTRVTLALILFALLGLMLFHVMFFPVEGDPEVFRVVFAMLSSLLSAVVGFYFGGRQAEKQVDKVMQSLPEALDPEDLVGRIAAKGGKHRLDLLGKAVERAKKGLPA